MRACMHAGHSSHAHGSLNEYNKFFLLDLVSYPDPIGSGYETADVIKH